MGKENQQLNIERSIYYSANDYSGKAINFDEILPIFIGYKKNYIFNEPIAPTKRFCYVLHFFSKGTCVFLEGKSLFKATPGDVFISKPHLPIGYEFEKNTPIDFAWIGFSGNLAKKLDDTSPLHHVATDYFSKIVALLDNEKTYAEPISELIFNALAEILSINTNNILSELKTYIDKHYSEKFSIEELCASYSYNRTYISGLFKKQYGCSLKAYLMDKRLNEAVKLLLDKVSVFEVSSRVGFSNPYNFSNAFKAKFRCSPSKYIKLKIENKKND